MPLTNSNWQIEWQQVPVRADMSMMQVLAMNTPQLSCINAGTGNMENSIMMLETIILMLLEYFGLEWSAYQIRESAELWAQEYYWLQLAEIKHFLTKCKLGKFGKVYGRFSPAVLMDWLCDYAEESLANRKRYYKQQADEQRYYERHPERRIQVVTQTGKDYQEGLKVLQELKEEWKKQTAAEREKELEAARLSSEQRRQHEAQLREQLNRQATELGVKPEEVLQEIYNRRVKK